MTPPDRASTKAIRRSLAALTVVPLVVTAGCDSGKTHTNTNAKTTTTPKIIRQALQPLPRPLLARCGTAGFSKPSTTPYPVRTQSGAIAGWQVSYEVPLLPGHAPKQGQTLFTAIERAPDGPRRRVAGGRDTTIAGLSVSLRIPPRGIGSYVAQWKTSKARYVVLAANMPTATLKRLIGCMP